MKYTRADVEAWIASRGWTALPKDASPALVESFAERMQSEALCGSPAPASNVVPIKKSDEAKAKKDARALKESKRPSPSAENDGLPPLDRDVKDRPKKTVGNAMVVLSQAAEWRGVIARDEFLEAAVLTRQPPQRECDYVAIEPGTEWSPQDSTRTSVQIARVHGLAVSSRVITEAMLAVAQRNVVHPIRQYLASLKWDGTPRVDCFAATYLGAPPDEYSKGVSRLLLLPPVARVCWPGSKVDTMVVLETEEQGKNKSTLLRELAGPTWFSDTQIPLYDKDRYQQLRGVWIYEIGELSSFKGKDANAVKAFISSPIDRFRPSYEPRVRAVPRQCVFVGTTNDAHYLADATGGRRFWPLKTPNIDVDAVKRDRDQLWAEAYARVRAGEDWWPDAALHALGKPQQEDRYEGDPWEEPIREWLNSPVRRRWVEDSDKKLRVMEDRLEPNDGILMTDVLAGALDLPKGRHGKSEQARAATVMQRIGWRRGRQKREGDTVVRRWFKPVTHEGGDALVTEAGDT